MTEQEQLHLKLKRLGVYEQFIYSTDEDDNYVDVSGVFEWDCSPEGYSFWSRIEDKVEAMDNILYKKIIGGNIL